MQTDLMQELEKQLAAMVRPPSALDAATELPPGVIPGTLAHALYLEWADAEARHQSFTDQDF